MAVGFGSNQSVERALGVLRVFTGRAAAELRVSDVAKAADLDPVDRVAAAGHPGGGRLRRPRPGQRPLPARPGHGRRSAARCSTAIRCTARPGRSPRTSRPSWDWAPTSRSAAATSCSTCSTSRAGRRRASFVLAGQRNPLHATGLGKALLTGLTPTGAPRAAAERAAPATPRAPSPTHDALDAELSETVRPAVTPPRSRSWRSAGPASRPRSATRRARSSRRLSVSGPAVCNRLAEPGGGARQVVIEAADSISIGLGYVGPHHRPGVRWSA